MFSFKSVYFIIFSLVLLGSQAEISDKRLCIDENCSELVAFGVTLINYPSPEDNILSFSRNEPVKIFSHGAGTRSELIGVELKGKRGYINKNHIKETHLLKSPKLLVDTELVKNKPEVRLETAPGDIKADPTQQPHEIVDGTVIPLDLIDFSTELPVTKGVTEQSNIVGTKPLDSENQNINEPTQSSNLRSDATKIKDIPQQLQSDDEDDDDDEEEDVDEDDEKEIDGDEEGDTKENQLKDEPPINTLFVNSPSSDPLKSGVIETAETPINVLNSSFEVLSKENAKIELEKKETVITNEPSMQFSHSSEPVNLLKNFTITEPIEIASSNDIENNLHPSGALASKVDESVPSFIDPMQSKNSTTTEPIESASSNVTENNVDQGIHSAENIHQESLASIVGESTPVLNKPNEASTAATTAPIVQSQNKETRDGLLVSTETILSREEKGIELNINSDQGLVESKELPSTEVNPSLSPPTTENPIEIEILAPEEVSSVTPNPLDVNGDGPPFSENYLPPNNQEIEFNNSEKNAEEGIEDLPSKGIFGGLGGILPLFNKGDDKNDKTTLSDNLEASLEESNDITNLESGDNIDLHFEDDVPKDVTLPNQNNIESTDDQLTKENEKQENMETSSLYQSVSFISEIKSFFGLGSQNEGSVLKPEENEVKNENSNSDNPWAPNIFSEQVKETPEVCDSESEKCPIIDAKQGFCDKENKDCPELLEEINPHREARFSSNLISLEILQDIFIETFSSDMFLYLVTTALSVLILIFVWVLLDKCRREGPLIARINKLEQQLLATSKENEMLQEKATVFVEEKTQLVVETIPNEVVEDLKTKLAETVQVKIALEEQIQALEKELDISTEVGIELNKLMSEMLSSTDGSEILKANIESMQKKVLEQQDTINGLHEISTLKKAENYELRRIDQEKNQQIKDLENEVTVYQNNCKGALAQEHILKSEIIALKQKVVGLQRIADTKIKEYSSLKDTLNTIKSVKNDKEALKSFLEVSEIKAQLEQIKSENLQYSEQLSQEKEINLSYITQIQNLSQEVKDLKEKYGKSDKEKVEIGTKLDVLNNYFKEKEDQMQKEISKYESLWVAKEGEATSTTERIRYMQEELQNYKAQNDSLKQEIISQEVELKSQISMLEKKSHENWVTNRQTERKLEEARQEAALLRNRLTMRERAIAEGNNQIRMQSPLHQNGALPISPPPGDSAQSPPPLFNPRDHITKSPPIPGMPPPPFLPPPLGSTPFIPPPPLDGMMPHHLGDIAGMPPFIPGMHPGMFPGDHRPPPLGRMSSPPPVGGRYTPESVVYSEYDRYDRRSPSPPYDSEYGASPPPIRGYSPYDDRDRDRLRHDRREYKRPQPRSNGRNSKGIHSSGSENDSLGKLNKKPQRKV